MATYSSILVWRIPWTEEPNRFSPTAHGIADSQTRLSDSHFTSHITNTYSSMVHHILVSLFCDGACLTLIIFLFLCVKMMVQLTSQADYCCRGLSHCRMFSSISAFYLLDMSKQEPLHHTPNCDKTSVSPDIVKYSHGRSKIPLLRITANTQIFKFALMHIISFLSLHSWNQ